MSPSEADPAVPRHVLREIERGFLGESRAAAAVREQIADFLARHGTEQPPPPILLRGEVAVGKSLLAQVIHRAGPRPYGPFVDAHLTAIPVSLLEDTLFGHVRGAFPGAGAGNTGLFQAANGGTIFLDEIGMLSEEVQAKILKVIEERSVRRLGSGLDEPVDVWIIAATSEDLRAMADHHRRYREAFNLHEPDLIENLYQQLGQLDLRIPPLRQRPDDILLFAEHFLARACAEYDLPPKSFAADARSAMLAYPWPGNVREVRHQMERMAILFEENDVITAAMLSLRNWK